MHTAARPAWLAILGLALGFSAGAAPEAPPIPIPSSEQILARLDKAHPRLLATAADLDRLRMAAATNATLKSWHEALRAQADKILREPPSRYEIPDGLRLLSTSRRVLGRVQTLGLLYRLDGDQRLANRAWAELEAAAAFQDWNPRHFLDTAEMTHAFAIGYDWLYDCWTADQRRVLREAMVSKGLKPALDIQGRNTGWTRARHNWNQVCNGGIGMGALALADEEPALCGAFLEGALKSLQLPMAEFAPDGAWAEGPGYWGYATSYNVVFLAALESALGTDFGLAQIPGFSQAGLFPIFASGPTGRSFDYADAHAGVIRAPQMFWLARRFNQPACAVFQRRVASPHPLDMIWYDPRGEGAMPENLPLDKHFRGSEVALLRGAWGDPEAVWVGFKAGDNRANHSHLDPGGFVLEALGQRFVVELGADDYNLPGYFGRQRWSYYRLRAEGHNTLVFNPSAGPDQDPKAAARITRFESRPERAFAIADLSAIYAGQARKVERGLALLDRRQVLVQDEFEAGPPAEVWWFLHTPALVEMFQDGRRAVLQLGGKELEARILSPETAVFSLRIASPLPGLPDPEKQNPNRGTRKLAIRLTGATRERVAVLLTPRVKGSPTPAAIPAVKPLAQW